MRLSPVALQTVKSELARAWKPRAPTAELAIPQAPRHPERFTSQIILSDGSSFRVRSTAPRAQVKITKDTRSHPLWNPQNDNMIDQESAHLTSFQKKFQGFDSFDISFSDDAEVAQQQLGDVNLKKRRQKKK
ncbi:hypothetical protein IWW51_002883 [Coemansia sp. RSA 2702]|nr:hypothetical protein IWW52_003110 [Coemansia sp. RSA 2704]KAJ2325233.1 hypothetical protein IWW51_002883 [Coemansia sp. RSA 2702]